MGPGVIGTLPILQWFQGNDKLKQTMLAQEPIGRVGGPEEISNAVAWQFSEASSFAAGAAIPVDGGLTAQ